MRSSRLRFLLACLTLPLWGGDPDLRLSVYATAGDIQRHLASPAGRQKVEAALRRLRVTRLFLEGRRGDEYVPPALLRELREHFGRQGIETAGGIATVPGARFGERQVGPLGWLNWESAKTRQDIAGFFRENAAVFDELIVDDFYCTGDTSPASEQARGSRPWGEYRQQLLTSLIQPLILDPARQVKPGVRMILKYPQWYDRFHLFGYAPERMSPPFDRIWVGAEVRNPLTRRMGFVQPTEGYINFRWISAVSGAKVEGAWFDHIESTAQNFVDQAWQSVLAGARELTLFRLGDIAEGHPGHALLEAALPELTSLAARVRGRAPRGVAFYKPVGSGSEENLYLMDYLAMLGLPVVPEAHYPASAKVAFLAVQAAADPRLVEKMRKHLDAGGTLVVTPALLRELGPEGERLARVRVAPQPRPAQATRLRLGRQWLPLSPPLEFDQALEGAAPLSEVESGAARHPWLFSRRHGRGRILVWNVRTFSEADFRETGEHLLAPKPLGLPDLPREVADELRRRLLEPTGLRFSAPSRVGLYAFDGLTCVYNFRDEAVETRLNGSALRAGPNRIACRGNL
jgi:hypothetical protein